MSAEVKTMDGKKTQQPTTITVSKDVPQTARANKDFLGGIKSEFKKISWTDPDELRLYTKMVVGATFLMGMGIYMMDLLIQGVLNSLGLAVQYLFG